MSKITIVIPCYNSEKYIAKCVESLKAQTYKDFKVIFINDASTDETLSILYTVQQEKDICITVLDNEINRGPAYSRNRAIEIADSEYITFCDCDDWYDTDYLEKMIEAIDCSKTPIALCGYKVVNEHGKIEYRRIIDSTSTLSSKEALRLESDSLCMLIVKTSLMKSTLLPDIRNGEDVAVVPLLIAKAQKCAVLSDCLYNYYRRSDSASEKPTMKAIKSLCDSFRYTTENFPNGNELELEYLGIKNMLYSVLITLFSIDNNRQFAIDILNDFENTYPFWSRNPYIKSMPMYKKVVLFCAKYRIFFVIRLMALVRMIRIQIL